MAKKVPITRFPDAATVSYSLAIEKMVNELGLETIKLFDKHVAPQLTIRQDADYTEDGLFDGIKKMFLSLKNKVSKIFSTASSERAASTFVKNINRFNRHNIEQQMKVKGIDLVANEPWLKDFLHTKITDNVGYIKTIHEDYFESIENVVNEGLKSGSSIKTIREQLMGEVEISKNKAQFIAVDQAGSILGQMTAQRHQNIGIVKFEWYDSADERVRKSHKKLSGETFSYSDPPDVNGRKVLPGEDYRCRCVAIPVFDDEEEELETQASFLKNRKEINENIQQNNPDISTEFRDYVSTATEYALDRVRTDFPKVDFENVIVDNGLFVEYDEEFTGIAAYFRRTLYINTSFGSIQKTQEFIAQSAEEGMFVKTKQGGMQQVIAHELGHAIEEQLIGIRNVDFQSELHELVKNYKIREQLSEYAEEEYFYGNHMELLSEAIALHYLGESTVLSEKIVKLMKDYAKR
ncbi:hypothetical protein FC756_16100 [Lysinibacillus mangiferihumi]|uniref:Phage head morphogenesis domain-containing protein n=1 Tax=Lysinibacillus mangiferihumi TaxID=1130819 RepID=A0A4U2YZ53_9BACI|nr:minor capsid protein [Lysinibacillus mangiferihumi]TKI65571.1 hypothetical protein FC756_16100 [Lysinibacillus mangiferihumi]